MREVKGPLIKTYSKPSSLFPNYLAAGPGLGTENWLHRSNAGTDTDPTWRIRFGREGQELQMFHGREGHRDEEFLKLLQGGSLFYFPEEKEYAGPSTGSRKFAFSYSIKDKTVPSESFVVTMEQ